MDKLIVEPLKSVNGISFGTNRETARKIMGCKYEEFKKAHDDNNMSDDFGFCHIFYNEDDTIEAVEIFPEVEVEIFGKSVFPNGLSTLKSLIPDLEEDEEGSLISKMFSVGVTIDVDEGNMIGILFGLPGYYM